MDYVACWITITNKLLFIQIKHRLAENNLDLHENNIATTQLLIQFFIQFSTFYISLNQLFVHSDYFSSFTMSISQNSIQFFWTEFYFNINFFIIRFTYINNDIGVSTYYDNAN